MRPELILNIEKHSDGYRWVLFHEDAWQSIDQGVKPSIAGALKSAFAHLAVEEDVDVGLTMDPVPDDFEYYTADMPRMKSGGGRMVKGSESPDFEKGARFLLERLR